MKTTTTPREPMYKVYRVMRKSGNKKTIEKNLTREQAKRLVNSFPNSSKSMVCFTSMLNS